MAQTIAFTLVRSPHSETLADLLAELPHTGVIAGYHQGRHEWLLSTDLEVTAIMDAVRDIGPKDTDAEIVEFEFPLDIVTDGQTAGAVGSLQALSDLVSLIGDEFSVESTAGVVVYFGANTPEAHARAHFAKHQNEYDKIVIQPMRDLHAGLDDVHGTRFEISDASEADAFTVYGRLKTDADDGEHALDFTSYQMANRFAMSLRRETGLEIDYRVHGPVRGPLTGTTPAERDVPGTTEHAADAAAASFAFDETAVPDGLEDWARVDDGVNPFMTNEGTQKGFDRTLVTAHFRENEVFVYTGGNCFRILLVEGQVVMNSTDTNAFSAGTAMSFTLDQAEDSSEGVLRCNGWCIASSNPTGQGLMSFVYNEHLYGPTAQDAKGVDLNTNDQGCVAMAYDSWLGLEEMNALDDMGLGHPGLYLRGDETY